MGQAVSPVKSSFVKLSIFHCRSCLNIGLLSNEVSNFVGRDFSNFLEERTASVFRLDDSGSGG